MEAHPKNKTRLRRGLNVRRDQFRMLKDSFANYVTNISEKSLVYYGSVWIEAKVAPHSRRRAPEAPACSRYIQVEPTWSYSLVGCHIWENTRCTGKCDRSGMKEFVKVTVKLYTSGRLIHKSCVTKDNGMDKSNDILSYQISKKYSCQDYFSSSVGHVFNFQSVALGKSNK